MYGVIEIAGHQYRVKPGDLVDVEKLKEEAGKDVELDRVLFVGGDKPALGNPVVEGAKATARVLKHGKSKKIDVFVRKPGLYRKKKGHRQQYTALLITELSDGQGNTAKIDANSKEAKKYLS